MSRVIQLETGGMTRPVLVSTLIRPIIKFLPSLFSLSLLAIYVAFAINPISIEWLMAVAQDLLTAWRFMEGTFSSY